MPSTAFHETGKGVQSALFHDSISDAIGSAIQALGGPKKVGGLLWPADPVSRAEARVRSCLNAERAEKFSPDELLRIAALARDAGDHSIVSYLCQALHYEPPQPVTPAEARAALQREFVESVRSLSRLAERIDSLPGDMR